MGTWDVGPLEGDTAADFCGGVYGLWAESGGEGRVAGVRRLGKVLLPRPAGEQLGFLR
ncbi:hypothetical protein EES44_25340 [Streptomyces sp. ADI96-15]|nr:Hypothetical protein B591_11305 [Streptomyces sp. GBA 94-10 4N24]RPK57648.1 hypothetical protein EES44_25340 [Streptomyces sp. ADI96-15]UZN59253.1 Hypothetical protein B591N_11305 [Streptomyces sp. GBA 94-10 4N24]